MRTITGFRRQPLMGVGAVLLLLFMVLVALAASPQLHHAIHADANTTGHHCVISALSQGHIESAGLQCPSLFGFV